MGGGRMAGQDRSMLGGMKALILVKAMYHDTEHTALPVFPGQHSPESCFENVCLSMITNRARWVVMAHVSDPSPCRDRNRWWSLPTNQYCCIKSRPLLTVGWRTLSLPSAIRQISWSRRCRWKQPGLESASASHMRKNL